MGKPQMKPRAKLNESILRDDNVEERASRFKKQSEKVAKEQMTVRMDPIDYVRFKELAMDLRMTNGDAVAELTRFYLEHNIKK